MNRLLDLLNSDRGSIVVSVILGLGLASLFRQTCKRNCVVIKAPDLAQLRRNVYEIDGTCYKYTPRAVACETPKTDATKP